MKLFIVLFLAIGAAVLLANADPVANDGQGPMYSLPSLVPMQSNPGVGQQVVNSGPGGSVPNQPIRGFFKKIGNRIRNIGNPRPKRSIKKVVKGIKKPIKGVLG